MTAKAYRRGTHRARSPEATLALITPLLARFGVTRAADVTGLDLIGIPTYCAIRPRGLTLQVSNGKGLRPVDAKVSALMEAIELHHAEHPPPAMHVASAVELRASGARVALDELCGVRPEARGAVGAMRRQPWVSGAELLSGEPAWLPASAVYAMSPTTFDWSSNGLASGNTLTEATLHAALEVIERDTLSQLCVGDDVQLEQCPVVGLAETRHDEVAELRDRIAAAGLELVVLRAPSDLPVTTYMAVLIDPQPFAPATTTNVGFGAHLSPVVAVCRAITEAAQSRLTFIHASREDMPRLAYGAGASQAAIRDALSGLEADEGLDEARDAAGETLEADLAKVLGALGAEGSAERAPAVYRARLTDGTVGVEVVKVMVANARDEMPL